MEIPMKAFGRFADEIEHEVRDFQVCKEILENHWLVAMYEEGSVHAAKIRIFLMCHSERSEESVCTRFVRSDPSLYLGRHTEESFITLL